eukprot:CAMPEP_0115689762 /NCGR_PEP_ID=MMETSP0272-20121206/61737_1 /TAXON_ID=71861 /ORGANISM="Scrippsiella trochoidea, Strain CCMP3099" /LENGTH=118 /DNA_ID=CAMNT_0003129579 /DNA_START=115 /DNA_END=468 /DNA_ORIENTATION=+
MAESARLLRSATNFRPEKCAWPATPLRMQRRPQAQKDDDFLGCDFFHLTLLLVRDAVDNWWILLQTLEQGVQIKFWFRRVVGGAVTPAPAMVTAESTFLVLFSVFFLGLHGVEGHSSS